MASAPLRRAPLGSAVLAAALVAASCRFCQQSVSFATVLAVPQRQPGPNKVAIDLEDRPEEEEVRQMTEEEEFRDRLKEHNLTVEFSFGEPDDIVPGVTNGSPYATCFVEVQDRSQRDNHGTVQVKEILEEWVMRGDQETVGRFMSWRQSSSNTQSVRCTQTARQAVEDTFCLECVSQSPSMALGGMPGSMTGTVHPSSVMTFSGAHTCLANTGRASGFCKSGTVTLPHF
ncbi:unnamed protein product [Polarella glacialis]|uniref:Uncharacterized protein n=1 Tax=Polarella glacialis TaxID=89957 RepID=A0A813KB44_POLGL|nr:unnamed protein product [Polarella glacialis]|mmetsp:Transcript_23206/g.37304  ORF Transcript_23206/g.37304 Transcript_23206/m.37304 type:complete len:230 (-) Transcript_23206:206-895(-)|eukprot:CAMPEP_0115150732 /NCGR_PEP_ID=MMETSP0227-20121206/65207_1 /TAXON_ID=89957 /ORGANISM="Polarella glacialis, Strain CCMP 1383" /LENGTH=229 /DNA_ID=CAMNT_0002561139 /DNA_START=137 /DNA_END=826 /DNA_ORIENTATION=-